MVSRRRFLKRCAAAGAGLCLTPHIAAQAAAKGNAVRTYHASISIDALDNDPELVDILKDAGVDAVWLACFFHGHWHRPVEDAVVWKRRIEAAGMAARQITVPLGHPTFTDTQPDYMPGVPLTPWKGGVRPDGQRYHGVCLHEGATEANVAAIRQLKGADPKVVFLDDDFRLAPSPNDIGGCFCEEHKQQFLQRGGYGDQEWGALIEAV
ncbi:MAG TPA: twin-arginine translocation signal domain-containing protein, partial [Candidatus Hydrogenedentes bacterium]|nr:twin-arginine translocation signal domain-containing protein [Candidatus Hydrogenedentota bacterium]